MKIRIRKRILFSIVLSLLLHVVLGVWSFFVKFIYTPVIDKPSNVMHVKISKENAGPEAQRSKINEMPKFSQPENPMTASEVWQPPTPANQAVKDNIASAVEKRQEPLAAAAGQAKEISAPQAKGAQTASVNRRAVRENLVEAGDIPKSDAIAGAPQVDSGQEQAKDFLGRSNPAVEVFNVAPARSSTGQDRLQMMQQSGSGTDKRPKAVDLGTALTYELYKYTDPKTSLKYFKLVVKVRDAMVNFPVIPKEIIFLTDASGSIGSARLKQTVEGLIYSLKHLNPEDRFNIIVFKDKTISFSPQSLKPTPANIKEALNFLNELLSGSPTDVYGALAASLNAKDSFSPSYRMLISDGFPTKGIVNARQVINEISDANKDEVSIFAFGGGVSISRYMLEFVAFKNRGWARFEDREYFIARGVSRLYDQIKDPLLLNLRYHISGVDAQEVFPRVEPDFFKGSEFVVYGTYANEGKIFLQMRGSAKDGKKEFVVNADLKDGLAGDKDVARQWAFHKVYFLISQLKYKEDNAELIREIDELCAYFNIVTPYSK